MRVLVTGGAGFIGSNLVDELVKRNEVIVIDNLSTGHESAISQHYGKRNFKFIRADIRDYKKMEDACKGVEQIYHLAVQCLRVSLYDPDIVHEVNVTGTLNMCKAALKNRVKKFIYISSSEAYGSAQTVPMSELHPTEPTTIYGASKLAGEYYTKAFNRTYGLNTTIVRPFNTYGPREHFEGPYGEVIPKFSVRVLNNKPPLIFGDGNQTRDFTYVSDIVRGIILAANSEELNCDVINIAYGQEVSIKDIAKYVLSYLNSDLKPKYCDPRPGDVLRHYADISKAKNMLKFKPKINIKDGIEMYLDWLKSQNIDFSKETDFNWLNDEKGTNHRR